MVVFRGRLLVLVAFLVGSSRGAAGDSKNFSLVSHFIFVHFVAHVYEFR